VMLSGGILGTVFGVWLFAVMRRAGQMDLVVSLSYGILLGAVGSLMLNESWVALRTARAGGPPPVHPVNHVWIHGLPLRLRFRQSRLYISVIPPILIGFVTGALSAIMGIGGGFIIVPAMIYLLRMPTNIVIGTSMFQIIFVTAIVTVLHATLNHSLDVVLALILAAGGVIGGQFGVRAGQKLRGEQLRALLGLMLLAVALRLLLDLVLRPSELYSIAPLFAGG